MSDIIPGSFPQTDTCSFNALPFALVERGPTFLDSSPAVAWTPGVIRVANVNVQPSLVQKWSVLGFSIRLRLALSCIPYDVTFGPARALLGTLYVGLMLDATLSPAGGFSVNLGGQQRGSAELPHDLSTFLPVWTGAEDGARMVDASTVTSQSVPDTSFGLIGETFMFPEPVDVRSGTNMQMAMVLTSSLMSVNTIQVLVRSCDYSVIYDDRTNG